jgi:ribosomal protein S18 acetylase RimI-like enzyme
LKSSAGTLERQSVTLDYSLRLMTETDLPAVAEIEAGVFTDWYRIYRREPEPLAERTLEELRYASSLDPGGNYVAVAEDGALVGFILSRTWGSVGWFGTFGVPTQFHGLGIGSELVARAVEYLSSKASIVGLETMPESGQNIGLYSKAGFVLTYPTLILEIPLLPLAERLGRPRVEDALVWGDMARSERSRALAGVREISGMLTPGLDFTCEVEALRSRGLGRTVLSMGRRGELEGFAVLRTAPFRRGDNSGRAYVHALGIRPGADAHAVLADLIRQIWATAGSLGLSRAAAGLNARNQSALELLKAHGFRVVKAGIRMVKLPVSEEFFRPTDAVELARWAG